MMTFKKTGRITANVTYLEMFEKPKGAAVQPPEDGLEIVRSLKPTLSFYRYLYKAVGWDWVWHSRLTMDDERLKAIITSEQTDIRVLWSHGTPAGYFELDFSEYPKVELAFFGLMKEFQGRHFGRFLLDHAIRHAFFKGGSHLWVHTCDLDHPRALGLYQSCGFEIFDKEQNEEEILEGMVLPEHAKNRQVRRL